MLIDMLELAGPAGNILRPNRTTLLQPIEAPLLKALKSLVLDDVTDDRGGSDQLLALTTGLLRTTSPSHIHVVGVHYRGEEWSSRNL